MGWTVDDDLAAHRAAGADFLAAEPVERTTQAVLLASVAAGARWSDAPTVYVRHHAPEGRLDAAGVMTPPHPLVLDGAPDPAGLVHALVAAGVAPAGVNARVPDAEAFAAGWSAARGRAVVPDTRLHLLALPGADAMVTPPPPAGTTLRAAGPGDLDAVLALLVPMRAELGERGTSPVGIVRDRIAAGLLWLLEDEHGPAATANATLAVVGVSRVAGVYTVPRARGRGYAAVVTAAATRAAYAVGATAVCLFTDAANPTSNGVYERLGYVRRPDDRLVLRFG